MRGKIIFLFTVSFVLMIVLPMNFVAAEWTSNLNDGLLGYYGMNNQTGTNVLEDKSGINNMTLYNGASYNSSFINGNSVSFTDYTQIMNVTTNEAYNFEKNESFSISFWAYFFSDPTVNNVFLSNDEPVGLKGIQINPDNRGFAVFLTDSWPVANQIRFNTSLNSQTVYNVVVTYNGNVSSGVKLYIQGQEQEVENIINNLNDSSSIKSGTSWGVNHLSNYLDPSYGFDGSMDEIGFWNRVLNSSEVLQLYNEGNGSFYSEETPQNETNQSLGYILWENESQLNVNSSLWWNSMDGFNATHFTNSFGKLTISTGWLYSVITSLINYNYVHNLGFYPSSNPSNYYNASTLPKSGISFSYYNLTRSDISTSSSSTYNVTILTLPLDSQKNISIECNLLVNSTAATTGVQLNSEFSSGNSIRQVIEYYNSSTMQAICQGTSTSLNCSATAGATIITPTRIYAYTSQQSSGTYTLRLKSEVAGSGVSVRAGSWCRSVEF
jgi:hypothetical protein